MYLPDRNSTQLRAALLADDWDVRFNAGLDLVKLGQTDGIPALIEGLGHQSRAVRNVKAYSRFRLLRIGYLHHDGFF